MRVNLKDYGRGPFIRFIRESLGLTQKEFADLLKKTERTIQGYEASDINYSIDLLEEIVKKTDLNIIAEKK